MVRDVRIYLEVATRALRRVPVFLGALSRDEYLQDELHQAAIERQLEIAGDALSRLRRADPALFARIPDGDLVVAFRNVLAHGYATLDHARVFEIAVRHAPRLLQALDELLVEPPDGDRQR